jgi:dTDP-4-dehydrorhamnose reductase
MKVVLIGANGQLGTEVQEVLGTRDLNLEGLTHQDIEITDAENVHQVLEHHKPDVVVNTAAYHNVEQCEYKLHDAFSGNALGAKNLAEAAERQGFYLIHISTDYVFDGAKRAPYLETDVPKPLNAYANTKLSGEHFLQASTSNALVLRTCGIYGRVPCRAKGGNNFVELMLKLAQTRDEVRVVENEVLTPTSARAVGHQISALLDHPVYGVAHGTAEGYCSWYQFAEAIFKIMDWDVNLNVAAPEEFPSPVNRPEYSVLDNQLLKQHGVNVFEHWEEGLRHYLLHEREAQQATSA